MRHHVNKGVPVVIGIFISDTFNNPQTWDRVGDDVVLGPDIGRAIDKQRTHAVVVVGGGDHGGDPVMLLRNSWGSNWGNNGHAWARESYLEPRLAGAFVITRGDCDALQSD